MGQAAPRSMLGRQVQGGDKERFNLSLVDLFGLVEPEIADLLGVALKDPIGIGQQNAELEDQIDVVLEGEEAAEIAHLCIPVADAVPAAIGFLLHAWDRFEDNLSQFSYNALDRRGISIEQVFHGKGNIRHCINISLGKHILEIILRYSIFIIRENIIGYLGNKAVNSKPIEPDLQNQDPRD